MLKVPICLSKHHVNSSARWSECITGVSEYFIRKCGKVRNGQDTDKRVSMEHKICEMSHQTSLFHSQILQCKTKRCEYPHISGTYGDIDKVDDHIYPYCCIENIYLPRLAFPGVELCPGRYTEGIAPCQHFPNLRTDS